MWQPGYKRDNCLRGVPLYENIGLGGGNSTPLHVMVLCPHLVQYFRNNGTRYYLLQYHIEEYFKSSDESMLNESNHDEI